MPALIGSKNKLKQAQFSDDFGQEFQLPITHAIGYSSDTNFQNYEN